MGTQTKKTRVSIKKLRNNDWYYIKNAFPKAFLKIRNWNFSIDKDGNPSELDYLDYKLFGFFDSYNIFVNVKMKDNEFSTQVIYNDEIISETPFFKKRIEAHEYGFLLATEFLDSIL